MTGIAESKLANQGTTAAEGIRRPDFFVIGQPKSGTTALHSMLSMHPEIFMSEPKEPIFLATDMRVRFQPTRSAPEIASLAEYLHLFDGAAPDQLAGEASTLYVLSTTAAQTIAALNPDAKIVVLFREPAAFLRSLHLQLLQTHVESVRSLTRALSLEESRRQGRRIPRRSHRPQLLRYSDHVRYTKQLQRYHDAFPPEQVLVLIYEDFRRDNEGVLRQVFRFLGVDESIAVEAVDANPTVRTRSQHLDDIVHRVSVGIGTPARIVKQTVKAVTPTGIRRKALETVQSRVVYGAPPPADPALMAELRARFRPEVERFSEYLGRDLITLWGYGDV